MRTAHAFHRKKKAAGTKKAEKDEEKDIKAPQSLTEAHVTCWGTDQGSDVVAATEKIVEGSAATSSSP